MNAAVPLASAVPVPGVRRVGIGEHRYRSVRFFRDPATSAWRWYKPWMTTLDRAGSRGSRLDLRSR